MDCMVIMDIGIMTNTNMSILMSMVRMVNMSIGIMTYTNMSILMSTDRMVNMSMRTDIIMFRSAGLRLISMTAPANHLVMLWRKCWQQARAMFSTLLFS